MIGASTAPIIFVEIHYLLIPDNDFTHEITWKGMTSFLEFMSIAPYPWPPVALCAKTALACALALKAHGIASCPFAMA